MKSHTNTPPILLADRFIIVVGASEREKKQASKLLRDIGLSPDTSFSPSVGTVEARYKGSVYTGLQKIREFTEEIKRLGLVAYLSR